MRLAIIIPVYNEKATVVELIDRVVATPPPLVPETGEPCDRIIVLVDDGSTDGTTGLVMDLARRPNIYTENHPRNRGKGAALRTGFAKALDLDADVLLVQDGDLEYSPEDHAAMVEPILRGRADVVIGSRFLGQAHRVLYYWHWVANQFITHLCNMFTNLNLTDIECCLKAMTADVARSIDIEEDRFGVEPELVAKVARLRRLPDGSITASANPSASPLRIYEVPVSYAGRTYAEGKKITWRDGFSAIRCIVKYSLR